MENAFEENTLEKWLWVTGKHCVPFFTESGENLMALNPNTRSFIYSIFTAII